MGTQNGGVRLNTDGLIFYADVANSSSYTGAKISDIIGNRNGTISGTTLNSSNGGSLLFNGSSSDYITYPFDDSLKVSSVTIECWFKPTSAGTLAQLFSIFNWDNFNFGLYARGFALAWNNNTFSFYYGDGFSVPAVVQTSSVVSTINKWCNIIVTYSLGVTKFYVNGTLQITRTNSSSYPIDWTYGAGQPTTIAISKKNNALDGHLQGHIGSIKVYNKVLSPSEVNVNYDKFYTRYN